MHRLVMLLLAVGLTPGCSNRGNQKNASLPEPQLYESRGREPTQIPVAERYKAHNFNSNPPESLKLIINVADHKVTQHQLVSNVGGLSIYVADKVSDGGTAYIKIKAKGVRDFYWLVPLPVVPHGVHNIVARRYSTDGCLSCYAKIPEYVNVTMTIKAKKVVTHRIEQIAPGKTQLYVSNVRKLATGHRAALIKSHIFKGEKWECKLPQVVTGTYKTSCVRR